MPRRSGSTVQRWGNSLAVRIPAAIAKSVGLSAGQPVELAAEDASVRLVPAGAPKLTLAQKLAKFDPSVHGGEAMAARPVGKEFSKRF